MIPASEYALRAVREWARQVSSEAEITVLRPLAFSFGYRTLMKAICEEVSK
jgi:hypothetical protein